MTDKSAEAQRLRRFKALPAPLRFLYGRSRVIGAIAAGGIAAAVSPGSLDLITHLLIGWDVAAAIYLINAYGFVFGRGVDYIRIRAVYEDDGRILILLLVAFGAFASIAAIVFELGIKENEVRGLIIALVTIVLSWATVHTAFALHYAHEYYHEGEEESGLLFPNSGTPEEPDYWDFVYFSLVIGMTFQVSDVGITDKKIRRTVTAHAVVSFMFNTALIALMVNIAASAI